MTQDNNNNMVIVLNFKGKIGAAIRRGKLVLTKIPSGRGANNAKLVFIIFLFRASRVVHGKNEF